MTEVAISRAELEGFVPHSGRMLFLDGLLRWSEDFQSLESIAVIGEDHPFASSDHQGQVPILVGFEYMAQSLAALSGLERHLRGDSEPRIGFVIGVRNFRGHRPFLPQNRPMTIRVEQIFRDGPTVSFSCRMNADGEVLAEGIINAYEPEDSPASREHQ